MPLTATNLSKKYGSSTVLNDVTIQISQGECVGVLGDNGSGKTTLLSIVAGMTECSQGAVAIDGRPVDKILQRKMGYVPQIPILVEDLTVRDNLALWRSVYHLTSGRGVLEGIPDCLGIGEMLPKRVSSLSGGMKKKLSIAIALMHRPDYLIMDEAFAALDAKTVEGMVAFLKESGMGILYSSHQMGEISALCHRVVVLRGGEITHQSQNIPDFTQDVVDELYRYF